MSQFVLEALDLPKDAAARPFRAQPIEELERHAPAAGAGGGEPAPLAPDAELVVSHNQVDDYQTCPLKYHYVHVLRIPLRRHHAVVYGSALHAVVEFYLRRRAAGNYTSLEDVLRAFDDAWRNEGFLTREHEEQRKRAGRGGADALLARGGSGGAAARRRREGVRLRARRRPGARPLRPRGRRPPRAWSSSTTSRAT